MQKFFLWITFLNWVFSLHSGFAQVKKLGMPFFKNYLPEQYNAENRNFAVVQDRRGVMYFANFNGILEFDGSNWQLIRLQANKTPTALAVDTTGKIYVGANNELGYLKPQKSGDLTFISLKDKLPTTEQNFKEIQKILIASSGVIFQTAEKLLIFQNNHFQILKTGGFIDQCFKVNEDIFVREWGTGLYKLFNYSLERVQGSQIFAYDRILAMLPFSKKRLMVVSRNRGISIYQPQADSLRRWQVQSFSPELNNLLITQQITCGIRLNARQIALGTAQDGVLVIDNQGQIIQHLNQTTGLADNQINDLYLDYQRNLWLTLEKGISYVEINSPFSVYNDRNGLYGTIMNSIFHQNRLYVGTSEGIFYRKEIFKTNQSNQKSEFQLIKNTKGYSGVPYNFRGILLYSHHNGVLAIEDTTAFTLMPNEPALGFTDLRQKPQYVLVAKLRGGLALLEKRGKNWIFKAEVKGIQQPCNSLIEDSNGNIWFSDYAKGIYKITFNATMDSVKNLTLYNQQRGLPAYSRNSIVKIKNRLAFITRLGVYRYVADKDRFEPDTELNKILFAGTYVSTLMEDTKQNIWFLQYGKIGFVPHQSNKIVSLGSSIFNKLKLNVLTHITPIDEANILFATQKGLFHYNLQINQTSKNDFAALIRQVSTGSASGRNSVIFAGAFQNEYETAGLRQARDQIQTLPYSLNNLKFNFAVAWYEETEHLEYQYFMKGLDNAWSAWSKQTEKSYTNLPEGVYIFMVKARNIYGQESYAATYQIIILPPWYRTWGAYIAYFLGAILLIFSLIRWNTWRLRRQNAYLAQEIEKGLGQIRQKNQELEIKNETIEQSYQNVKLLNEIGQIITAELSVAKIVDAVYFNINQLMDAPTLGVGIYNPQTQEIEFIGAKENGETLPPFKLPIENKNRLAVWCFENRQAILLNDYPHEYHAYIAEYQSPIFGEPVTSVIYLPLWSGEEVKGVLTVQSFAKNAYTDYHLNILKNLAIYISIALENAQAYQILAELNLEKNHLIGIVAHDLRNPLHNIYGLAQVIQLNSENLSPKQADYLRKIIDSVARLNALINKVLDLKAIESSTINLQLQSVDLLKVLHQVQTNLLHEAQRKNIVLRLDYSSEPLISELDENYTYQVFENLISNALKFSQPNEQILIQLSRQNGSIYTTIQDNGPGIKPEEKTKLFGKFQKLSAKPTAGEHSVGLGLSIVKKYVELMQGKVWCESEVGKGATFIVEFKALSPSIDE
ncbi:MAG: ATP-binding protein [Microscillaceae bacterium]|jgi:signal transduction histidine kinase/ligand-binding sensor domain-containing protein|nr:ATP-binding protein [Microscillaceae bacterium]